MEAVKLDGPGVRKRFPSLSASVNRGLSITTMDVEAVEVEAEVVEEEDDGAETGNLVEEAESEADDEDDDVDDAEADTEELAEVGFFLSSSAILAARAVSIVLSAEYFLSASANLARY
jgi:hypothetical protein